jgi:uncharacterized protein (UPF0335 family)
MEANTILNGVKNMSDTNDDMLRLLIERIERQEEEKKDISDSIREIYSEAKSHGYDVKILRAVIRLRKMEANERAEYEVLLETYMNALGG